MPGWRTPVKAKISSMGIVRMEYSIPDGVGRHGIFVCVNLLFLRPFITHQQDEICSVPIPAAGGCAFADSYFVARDLDKTSICEETHAYVTSLHPSE